ncbi:hypothetical protein AYO21_07223 [Fonsecaea monophora]|uniref:Uncharacterized protein n=1 Tax=Fonsecaea monophora TaxID=254056 RepID=A0A177F2P9_9EURO|nr:hypothetical protein AYO21_07223 [Fonsecaea monophora]KAH0843502.1 hypothetical protein FOPE_08671 [Fonsecaea pedrosoi]OAG38563.1 hypothetical protein AYO21_07223 [Fonsecaea monophora]
MAAAVALDTPSPRQPYALSEGASTTCLRSPQQTSPRRSPYFANSTPSQEPDKENTSSPSRPYTFTPRRVKSLPRAWERRPATPFVARNDAQKIWKRVPLGAIGANIGENWRKENRRLATRPVKRLRISHLGGEEDQENADYIASKWDEDGMTTPSPKRKVLECGVFAMDQEDQNTSNEADDGIEDDEDRGISEHRTASPVLGNHDGAEDRIEIENSDMTTKPLHVLDSVTPPLQAADLPQPLSPITELMNTSSTSSPPPATMPSSSNASMPALDEDLASGGNGHQDAPLSFTVSSIFGPIESVASPPDHDDTAYLHDFLSRARARKAAKEQATEENTTTQLEESADPSMKNSSSSHIEDVTSTPPEATDSEETPTIVATAPEPEVNVSPRRSSRLFTRLPRLQKPATSLPNTISLKRLNGTEFIAARNEAESLAVTTRTNTKSNKNGAVSAKVRLLQMDAEQKARQFSEEAGAEQPNPETGPTKKSSKRKEVAWAEKLATFHGEVEESTVDETVMGEVREDEGCKADSNSEVDSNSEAEGGAGGKEGVEQLRSLLRQQNRGVKKVRRLRKLNGGSVNGTPAPKKTTNIPLPTGSKSLSAKVFGLTAQTEDVVGSEKDAIQTRARRRISMGV